MDRLTGPKQRDAVSPDDKKARDEKAENVPETAGLVTAVVEAPAAEPGAVPGETGAAAPPGTADWQKKDRTNQLLL